MKLTRLFALLLCLLPLSVAHSAPRPWTRVVAATPDGGFRIGNPAARIKLVEYGSLTCPHCRAFDEEAWLPLSAYVRKGQVSFEFRNYVLNGIDVAASLVARCNGAASFYPTVRDMYANQASWVDRIGALSAAEREALNQLPDGQRTVRIAQAAGLIAIGQKHGIAPARARACLADPRGLARLDDIKRGGRALGVTGTPTFFVNGEMVGGIAWADVDEALKRAGG